ncbi:GlmU family protein [Prosthecochloris sp.]|uniref:GlmU family protein n=1 Tax=Prosthecochloris sp. TaxID=290513 RepID=UPI00257BCDFC|nr:GlmU family protein [Prosthecochloris sp.]
MQIVIFEDEVVYQFGPLVHFKPVYCLSTGCRTLLEKFRFHLGPDVAFSCHLRSYLRPVFHDYFSVFQPDNGRSGDLLLVNGRLICTERVASIIRYGPPAPGQCLVQGDDLIVARMDAGEIVGPEGGGLEVIDTQALMAEAENVVVDGFKLLRNIWDPVAYHPEEIEREAGTLELGRIMGEVSSHAVLENPENIYIGQGARVKPGAVLDAESGFVYVSPGALIEPQAVLAENVFLGGSAVVKTGANLHCNVSIGRAAKTGGEIEDSIVERYANKQHDGFLGHSYISSWCNLGAGSNTSDLRNNYGKVKMVLDEREVETGEQFLGLLMGEHTKCAINSMFNTGTIVGTSANIFGRGFPPKNIPSFSWGGPGQGFQHYDVDKALETARVVMARRNIAMNTAYEKMFRYVAAMEQGRKVQL